jgi:hypothetical protein
MERFEEGRENDVVLDVKEGIVEAVWFSASCGWVERCIRSFRGCSKINMEPRLTLEKMEVFPARGGPTRTTVGDPLPPDFLVVVEESASVAIDHKHQRTVPCRVIVAANSHISAIIEQPRTKLPRMRGTWGLGAEDERSDRRWEQPLALWAGA